MNNIVNEMCTLINNNSQWTTNRVRMWSYKNFTITKIVLVHKDFASTHLVT
jgi:hypothetical protein